MDIRFAVRYVAVKTFWFFGRPIQQAYRMLCKPAKKAVKVIIENEGAVLLIRPNYAHRKWSLPGGGLNKNESFEAAVRREIQEELGVSITGPIEFLGAYPSKHANFDVRTFVATTPDRFLQVDGIEIQDARWFDPNILPEDRSHRMDPIIVQYRQKHKMTV